MIKLIELLETDVSINWWKRNRKRLNEVIQEFNDWQIEHRFNPFKREVLIAKIKLCREFGEANEFSDWQFKILDEMTEFIEEHSNK